MNTIKNTFLPKKNTSLITKISQILAIFIALALAGVVSSLLISENINDNATKMNMAASLGMLAARIPLTSSINNGVLDRETLSRFQQQLDLIKTKSLLDVKKNNAFAKLLADTEKSWANIKNYPSSVDEQKILTKKLDNIISYFQSETKNEILLLRIIQYLGLFMMVIIGYITIYRSQDRLVAPFKRLLQVATEAGHGNFTTRADEHASGELGILARNLNEMNKQLSLSYQDFESESCT